MKTILFRKHGSPDVLEYADFETPEPAPGEALVKLHTAALNRMDLLVRAGWPGLKLALPHILGADGAGEVVAFPPVKNGGDQRGGGGLKIGDRVAINANLGCGDCDFCLAGRDNLCRNWHLLGETVHGTYAEFIALPSRQLFRLPKGFDYHAAAAASLVYQTAWHSLITRGNLRPGETVLIVGASGGVMEAAVRTAYFKLTGKELVQYKLNAVRGTNLRKEATLQVGDLELNIAVVSTFVEADKLIQDIKDGKSKAQFIEVMACPRGCIGGGGQPLIPTPEAIKSRMQALYDIDDKDPIKASHKNPYITQLYKEYLIEPLGEKSHHLLHTHYEKRNVLL